MASRRESPRAERSRIAFLNAGISDIAQFGVDHITVSGVTEKAGSTRPTFYSHFGSVPGLLAEIWLEYGQEFLALLIDPQRGNPQNPETETPRFRSLLEILAIARRMPELFEVVEPSIAQWWETNRGNTPLSELIAAWILGERLGVFLTMPIDNDVVTSEFVIPLIAAIDPEFTDNSPLTPVPTPTNDSHRTPHSVGSELLDNTIAVVASAGVGNTSLTRIARRMRTSTGAIYPLYNNVHTVIVDALLMSFPSILDSNIHNAQGGVFRIEDLAVFINTAFRPGRDTWRRFRLEMLLAGRVDEQISQTYSQALQSTMHRLEKHIAGNMPRTTLQGATYFTHAMGVGFGILYDFGVPVGELDHRLMTAPLKEQLIQ